MRGRTPLDFTHVFDVDFNPSNKLEALPVVERERVPRPHPQELTTKDTVHSKLRFERFLLFEVLEEF